MALTLHRTLSTAHRNRDWLDYVIINGGRYVGRLYEDGHSRPASRWFWAIAIYDDPFLTNWRKCSDEPAST